MKQMIYVRFYFKSRQKKDSLIVFMKASDLYRDVFQKGTKIRPSKKIYGAFDIEILFNVDTVI